MPTSFRSSPSSTRIRSVTPQAGGSSFSRSRSRARRENGVPPRKRCYGGACPKGSDSTLASQQARLIASRRGKRRRGRLRPTLASKTLSQEVDLARRQDSVERRPAYTQDARDVIRTLAAADHLLRLAGLRRRERGHVVMPIRPSLSETSPTRSEADGSYSHVFKIVSRGEDRGA